MSEQLQGPEGVVARQYDLQYATRTNIRLGVMDSVVADGRQIRQELVDCIDLSSLSDDSVVVDVGCADGAVLKDLRERRGYNGVTTGLDIDISSLVLPKGLKREGIVGPSFFVVGDMSSLPFPDRSADAVISSFAFHHASDPAVAVEEASRVLKDGGQLVVTANSLVQKDRLRQVLDDCAELLGIEPPRKFAELFNTETAPKILSQRFRIEEIKTQITEMIFTDTDDDFDMFIQNLMTYFPEFSPAIVSTEDRNRITEEIARRAYYEGIRTRGYFTDNIDREIYVCRKLPEPLD